MKLWKENKINQEWKLSNKEIAKQFLKSKYARSEHFTATDLVLFISSNDGLNSVWDWERNKGSVNGSKDILEILDIIDKTKEVKPNSSHK